MPIPPNATALKQPLDPKDIVDWNYTLLRGVGDNPFLQAGESVASFTLAVTSEAAAAGLVIKSGGGYDPTVISNVLRFWLSIDPAHQSDSVFNGAGSILAFEFTATTDSIPARVKQRTFTVQVVQL